MNGNVEEWTWDWYGNVSFGYAGLATRGPDGCGVGFRNASFAVEVGTTVRSFAGRRIAPTTLPATADRGLGLRLVRTIFGHCSPNPCPTQSTCNPTDGTCDCENEYMTEDCSACEEGYTGFPDCTLAFSEGYCETSQCWPVPSTGQTACYKQLHIHCLSWRGWFGNLWHHGLLWSRHAQYPDNERTFTCYNAAGVETPLRELEHC